MWSAGFETRVEAPALAPGDTLWALAVRTAETAFEWQVRDVPGFVAAMDRLLRMNLELETDRTKARHEVSGPDGGPVETAEVSDEERARRLQAGIEAARRKLMGQVAAAVVDTDEEQPLD